MVSVLKIASQRYERALATRPMITQMISNLFLWGMGDGIAQGLENQGKKEKTPFDFRRNAIMATYGFCIAGPVFAKWYPFLEKTFKPLKDQGKHVSYVASKIGADQFIFEPLYLCLYFAVTAYLSGKSHSQTKDLITNEFLTTFIVDCAFWPAAQAINFTLIPIRHQAIFVSVLTVGWAAFLSFMSQPRPKVFQIATDMNKGIQTT